MEHGHQHTGRSGSSGTTMHYRHLLIMMVLSALAMCAFMYAMVNELANVYVNLNQVYMVGVMVAPMIVIELIVMHAMYRDRRLNAIVVATSLIIGIGCWTMIRHQTAISDAQFLRSMIPHHGAAILMCQQAPVQDAEIKDLCKRIIASQQAEIDLMRSLLTRSAR